MKGLFTALVTPFKTPMTSRKHPMIDWEAYDRLLDFQIAAGVSGVVPGGSTGESMTLSLEEKKELLRFTLQKVQGSPLRVIAYTGSACTEESCLFSEWAVEAGAAGVLVIVPYYNKPSQDGLVKHFLEIADRVASISSSCEVIPYLNPSRTQVSLSCEALLKLSRHPSIRSVKESTAQLSWMSDWKGGEFQALKDSTSRRELEILSGDDLSFFPFQALGWVQGAISVATNLIPKAFLKLSHSFSEKAYWGSLYPFLKRLSQEVNPLPIKTLVASQMGFEPIFRAPLVGLSGEREKELRQAFEHFQHSWRD